MTFADHARFISGLLNEYRRGDRGVMLHAFLSERVQEDDWKGLMGEILGAAMLYVKLHRANKIYFLDPGGPLSIKGDMIGELCRTYKWLNKVRRPGSSRQGEAFDLLYTHPRDGGQTLGLVQVKWGDDTFDKTYRFISTNGLLHLSDVCIWYVSITGKVPNNRKDEFNILDKDASILQYPDNDELDQMIQYIQEIPGIEQDEVAEQRPARAMMIPRWPAVDVVKRCVEALEANKSPIQASIIHTTGTGKTNTFLELLCCPSLRSIVFGNLNIFFIPELELMKQTHVKISTFLREREIDPNLKDSITCCFISCLNGSNFSLDGEEIRKISVPRPTSLEDAASGYVDAENAPGRILLEDLCADRKQTLLLLCTYKSSWVLLQLLTHMSRPPTIGCVFYDEVHEVSGMGWSMNHAAHLIKGVLNIGGTATPTVICDRKDAHKLNHRFEDEIELGIANRISTRQAVSTNLQSVDGNEEGGELDEEGHAMSIYSSESSEDIGISLTGEEKEDIEEDLDEQSHPSSMETDEVDRNPCLTTGSDPLVSDSIFFVREKSIQRYMTSEDEIKRYLTMGDAIKDEIDHRDPSVDIVVSDNNDNKMLALYFLHQSSIYPPILNYPAKYDECSRDDLEANTLDEELPTCMAVGSHWVVQLKRIVIPTTESRSRVASRFSVVGKNTKFAMERNENRPHRYFKSLPEFGTRKQFIQRVLHLAEHSHALCWRAGCNMSIPDGDDIPELEFSRFLFRFESVSEYPVIHSVPQAQAIRHKIIVPIKVWTEVALGDLPQLDGLETRVASARQHIKEDYVACYCLLDTFRREMGAMHEEFEMAEKREVVQERLGIEESASTALTPRLYQNNLDQNKYDIGRLCLVRCKSIEEVDVKHSLLKDMARTLLEDRHFQALSIEKMHSNQSTGDNMEARSNFSHSRFGILFVCKMGITGMDIPRIDTVTLWVDEVCSERLMDQFMGRARRQIVPLIHQHTRMGKTSADFVVSTAFRLVNCESSDDRTQNQDVNLETGMDLSEPDLALLARALFVSETDQVFVRETTLWFLNQSDDGDSDKSGPTGGNTIAVTIPNYLSADQLTKMLENLAFMRPQKLLGGLKVKFYLRIGLSLWKEQCFDIRKDNEKRKCIIASDSIRFEEKTYDIGNDLSNFITGARQSQNRLLQARRRRWLTAIRVKLVELVGEHDSIPDPLWYTKSPEERYKFYISSGLSLWKIKYYDKKDKNVSSKGIIIKQSDQIMDSDGEIDQIGIFIRRWISDARCEANSTDCKRKRMWLTNIRSKLVELVGNLEDLPNPLWSSEPDGQDRYLAYLANGLSLWKIQCYDNREEKGKRKGILLTDEFYYPDGQLEKIGDQVDSWKKVARASTSSSRFKTVENRQQKQLWLIEIRKKLVELVGDLEDMPDPLWHSVSTRSVDSATAKFEFYLSDGLALWKEHCFQNRRDKKVRRSIAQLDEIVYAGKVYKIGKDVENYKTAAKANEDSKNRREKREWLEEIRRKLVELVGEHESIPDPLWRFEQDAKYSFYISQGLCLWLEQCYQNRKGSDNNRNIIQTDTITTANGIPYQIGYHIRNYKAAARADKDSKNRREKRSWLVEIRKKLVELVGEHESIPNPLWETMS